MFDHSSHYDYLMTAAAEMEAVVQEAALERDAGQTRRQLKFALGGDIDDEQS